MNQNSNFLHQLCYSLGVLLRTIIIFVLVIIALRYAIPLVGDQLIAGINEVRRIIQEVK